MPFVHKNIRLVRDRYIGPQWYSVTLCCDKRKPIFADHETATRLIELLREESAFMQFSTYAYCVMPDHVHLLVLGVSAESDLRAFIKRLKQKTAHEFRKQVDGVLWQKKFYDHILRHDEDVATVAAYIWMNPVRKGMCREPREYPYSGSFVVNWFS